MIHSPEDSMKKRFVLVIFVLILVAGFAVAVEKNTAEVTSAGEVTTESVVPELSKIVVLCATEEEEKFEKEWSKYVAHNDLKGAELQKTITWVSDEAVIQRKKHKSMHGDESNDEEWKEERQKMMNEFARRARLL